MITNPPQYIRPIQNHNQKADLDGMTVDRTGDKKVGAQEHIEFSAIKINNQTIIIFVAAGLKILSLVVKGSNPFPRTTRKIQPYDNYYLSSWSCSATCNLGASLILSSYVL